MIGDKKDIKYLYYKLRKELFLRNLNKILCKNVIESDKVMFYVDNHYLYKLSKKTDEYNLEFYTINKDDDEKKKTYFDYYDLNKPFYYVIDGMIFDKKVNLSIGDNSIVVFRNCIFKEGIEIKNSDKLILSNNKYYCRGSYSSICDKHYLTGKNMNELTLINEDFSNKDYSHHPTPNFGINIESNKLNIINTNVNTDRTIILEGKPYYLDIRGEIILKSNELNISNSIIKSPNIYIESNSIKNDKDTSIESSQCIVIENKNEDMKLNNIKTPYLIYNNKERKLVLINKINRVLESVGNKKMLKKIRGVSKTWINK